MCPLSHGSTVTLLILGACVPLVMAVQSPYCLPVLLQDGDGEHLQVGGCAPEVQAALSSQGQGLRGAAATLQAIVEFCDSLVAAASAV